MRDVLNDIVKQTSVLFEEIKITGKEDETKISACDKEKTLFLAATLKKPSAEFLGEFGISNISLLNGLLNFASYKTETAKFVVKRDVKQGNETVCAFSFKDASGSGANFATKAAHLVGEQAVIGNIPWDVHVSPTKAKIAEFSQLASLYSEVSKDFGVHVVEGSLVLSIGTSHDTTHNATLVFASEVEGKLSNDTLMFNAGQFFSVLKLAGSGNATISISTKGVLGITVNTEYGSYNYYLRAHR